MLDSCHRNWEIINVYYFKPLLWRICSTKNDKVFNSLYYKFYIASWFSQNVFLFLLNSCIHNQPTVIIDEQVKFHHEHWLIFLFIVMSRLKVKHQRHILIFYSFASAERLLFWIRRQFLNPRKPFNFGYYSQCNYYRHEKLLCLLCIINTFPITLFRLGQKSINIFNRAR